MKLSLELWESIFGVGRGAAAAGSERSRGGKVKEAILYPLARVQFCTLSNSVP